VKREWEQRREAGEEPEEKFDVVFNPNDARVWTTDSTPTTTMVATTATEKTTEVMTTQPHRLPEDNIALLLALFGELAAELWVLLVRLLATLLSLLSSIAATP
jgi:hypothetical protein